MTSIVQLQGVNDQNEVRLFPGPDGQIQRGLRGTVTMAPHLGLTNMGFEPRIFFGAGVRQPRYPVPEGAVLAFNEITESDTHRVALRRAADFCDRAGLPVINHPAKVARWTRDAVARALSSIPGVVTPATVRLAARSPREVLECAAESGLEFPLIFRTAGDHVGHGVNLLRGEDDERVLHRYAFDGREFYLSEFLAARGDNGLYRKHRINFVDRQPLPAAYLVNEHWNAHPDNSRRYLAQHPELGREAEFLKDLETRLAQISPTLNEISDVIDLDFFTMDFQIRSDGRLLIYEANVNMNISNMQPPGLEPWVSKTRGALRKLIERRLA